MESWDLVEWVAWYDAWVVALGQLPSSFWHSRTMVWNRDTRNGLETWKTMVWNRDTMNGLETWKTMVWNRDTHTNGPDLELKHLKPVSYWEPHNFSNLLQRILTPESTNLTKWRSECWSKPKPACCTVRRPAGSGWSHWGVRTCVTCSGARLGTLSSPPHWTYGGVPSQVQLWREREKERGVGIALHSPAIVKVFSKVSWPVLPSTCLLKVQTI